MAHGSLHAVAASSWFVASKTPLAILDSQARFQGANPAYLKATVRVMDELLGSVVFNVFPDNPDDPDADGVRNLTASLQRVMRSGRPHDMVIQRYDIPSADDHSRWAYKVWSPANAPIEDDEGSSRRAKAGWLSPRGAAGAG